jgi:hypothetical protein
MNSFKKEKLTNKCMGLMTGLKDFSKFYPRLRGLKDLSKFYPRLCHKDLVIFV